MVAFCQESLIMNIHYSFNRENENSNANVIKLCFWEKDPANSCQIVILIEQGIGSADQKGWLIYRKFIHILAITADNTIRKCAEILFWN